MFHLVVHSLHSVLVTYCIFLLC